MNTLAALIRAHQQDPTTLHQVPETARESTPGRYDASGSQRSPALDRRVEREAARAFAADNFPGLDPSDIGSFEDIQDFLDIDTPDLDLDNTVIEDLDDVPADAEGVDEEPIPADANAPLVGVLGRDDMIFVSDDGLSKYRRYYIYPGNYIGFGFFADRPTLVAYDDSVKYSTDIAEGVWEDIEFPASVIDIPLVNGDFEAAPTFSEFAPGWQYVSGDSPRVRMTNSPAQMPGSTQYLTRDWVVSGTGDFEVSQTVDVPQAAQDALGAGGELKMKADVFVADGATAKIRAVSGTNIESDGFPIFENSQGLLYGSPLKFLSGSGGVGSVLTSDIPYIQTQDGRLLNIRITFIASSNTVISLTGSGNFVCKYISGNTNPGYGVFDFEFFDSITNEEYTGPMALSFLSVESSGVYQTPMHMIFQKSDIASYDLLTSNAIVSTANAFGFNGEETIFFSKSGDVNTNSYTNIYLNPISSGKFRVRMNGSQGRVNQLRGPLDNFGDISTPNPNVNMTKAPNYTQAVEASVIFEETITSTNGEWSPLLLNETASIPYPEISVHLSASGSPADVWFDNVQLEVVAQTSLNLKASARDVERKSLWVADNDRLFEIKGTAQELRHDFDLGFDIQLLAVNNGEFVASSGSEVITKDIQQDLGANVRQLFIVGSPMALLVDGRLFRLNYETKVFELVSQLPAACKLSYYKSGQSWSRFDQGGPIYTSTDLIAWTFIEPTLTLTSQRAGSVFEEIPYRYIFWFEGDTPIFHRYWNGTATEWKYGGSFPSDIVDIQVAV
tara:strand:- start:14654 stop:17008 length:2355 start_codon:yes stop_codon:yes gene_type:complete